MALAGLWERFEWPDGTVTRTLRIVTTDADSMMAEIHDPGESAAPNQSPECGGEC